MYIEYEDIHKFKRYDLPEIFRSYGHKLKKTRDGYMTICPFHDDKNPSLSINKKGELWLWHCFGCGKGGSVIDFVMKRDNVCVREAYQKLKALIDGHISYNESIPKSKPRDPKIIEDVLRYYESVFKKSHKSRQYLHERHLTNPEIYERFRIGYSDGTIPKQKEFINDLKSLGILGEKGGEIFYKCVIFPIEDINGNVVGIYGRRPGTKDHRYLQGRHKGVFNARAFKASKTVYLTECVIDALSLYQVGIRETVSLFGAKGFTPDHLKYMRENLTREVILCLDQDETGKESTRVISRRLSQELGIKCSRLILPKGVKDINEWLIQGMNKEDVLNNVKIVNDIPTYTISLDKDNNTGTAYKFRTVEKEYYFDFICGPNRGYRVRGLELNKIGTLRTSLKMTTNEGSHLDTFDLVSSVSRERFKKTAKKLLNIEEKTIHQDLNEIIDKLEDVQSKYLATKNKDRGQPRGMSIEERQEAFKMLKDPGFLKRVMEDFHKCGYMGEDMNLLMGYVAATSRKLPSPLSLLVISRSSAGKTSLQDAVLSFVPEEDVIKYTRLTDQSLFYHEEDSLYKKVLAIEEEAGASGAGYAIRNVVTSKFLKTGSTIKDPQTGILKNQNTNVKIQTSVFLTTTRNGLDHETMNRFVIATIDESEYQTRRILEYQRRLYGEDGYRLRKEKEALTRLHNNAQRLIEPMDVVNPYQDQLTFTTRTLRARREQVKYLTLINTVTLLRQYQRTIKERRDGARYIEVEPCDIDIANKLAKVYITKSLDCLSPQSRALYEHVRAITRDICVKRGIDQDKCIISRREIMEYTGWSEWQVRTHLWELVEMEYIITIQGKQGKRYCYRLVEDIDYELPTVDIGVVTPKNIPDNIAKEAVLRPENQENRQYLLKTS